MSLDWINPGALVGLAAIAGPIFVHLLRRQRAPRVTFPTVRFLAPTRGAAARLRNPSDLWLLCLRIAIVAAAAVAAAQPVLVTSGRRAAWEERLARVLLIDESESMDPAAARVRDAIAAERRGATNVPEIRTTDLADGLKQAAAAFGQARAGRAEIVVISDFQLGSLTAADASALPADIGLRFVAIDAPRVTGPFAGLRTFDAAPSPSLEQQITLDGPRTRVTIRPAGLPARSVTIVAPPAQADDVAALKRIVAAAGAPGLPADRGFTMIFPGAPVPAVEPLHAGWMVGAFAAASADERLRSVAFAHVTDRNPSLSASWTPVARNRSGHPVVLAAAMNQDLVAYVSAAPSELVAPAALRSLLFAVSPPAEWPEREVERLGTSQLAAWTREARPPAGRWSPQPPGDARWLWGLALLLLLVEGIVRRTRLQSREEQAHAA